LAQRQAFESPCGFAHSVRSIGGDAFQATYPGGVHLPLQDRLLDLFGRAADAAVVDR
jgi:hypothetical protein